MNNYIWFLLILSFVSILFSLLAFMIAVKSRNTFRKLIKITGKESLDEILAELINFLNLSKKEQMEIKKTLIELTASGELHLQKSGMVRFNPFAETGGEQSFSLALLNGQSNGFVISSLHNRDQTRMYIKAIAKGSGDGIELSKEERKAIDKALKH